MPARKNADSASAAGTGHFALCLAAHTGTTVYKNTVGDYKTLNARCGPAPEAGRTIRSGNQLGLAHLGRGSYVKMLPLVDDAQALLSLAGLP